MAPDQIVSGVVNPEDPASRTRAMREEAGVTIGDEEIDFLRETAVEARPVEVFSLHRVRTVVPNDDFVSAFHKG